MDASPHHQIPRTAIISVLGASLALWIAGCQLPTVLNAPRPGARQIPAAKSAEGAPAPVIRQVSDTEGQALAPQPRKRVEGCPLLDCAPPEPTAPHDLFTAEAATRELSLSEAIRLALSCNRYLRVVGYAPHIIQQNITLQDSRFHPQFILGAQYRNSESQIANAVNGPGIGIASAYSESVGAAKGIAEQFRIYQRTRGGGMVSGSLVTFYDYSRPGGDFLTLNPSFRSAASVEIDHPFLRGAGREVTETDLYIATDRTHAERWRLETAIHSTVAAVADAYWQLYEADAVLQSRLQGVTEAAGALRREIDKYKLGASTVPEVGAVREQLARFRVNLGLQQGVVARAERKLRTVTGLPREEGCRLVLTTAPRMTHRMPDWETATASLSHRRPEIRLEQFELQAAVREYRRAENFRLPDISGNIGYSISGTEDDFERSWQTTADSDYGQWWAGLKWEHSIGRCADKARLRQTELEYAQPRASLAHTTDQALDELHGAWQELQTAWRNIQLSEEQRDAAARVLEARREMHELGETDI